VSGDITARLNLDGQAAGAVAAVGAAEAAVERLGEAGRQSAGDLGGTARKIDEVEAAARALTGALDPAAAAQRRLTQAANDSGAAMGAASRAGLGLSRQFADVGVSAAMGLNPLMILIQQGPQIADEMALMGRHGVTMGAAFRAMGGDMARVLGMLAPLAPAAMALGVAAGAAFGGAALAARALNKENGDLTKGMGLTEQQLQRLKEKGTDTGVTIGDVFRGTFNVLKDAAANALKPVGDWFSDLFDKITRGAVAALKGLVGGFTGALEVVKATWSMLPAAMADIMVSTAQKIIDGITAAINYAIQRINSFTSQSNDIAKRLGAGPVFGQLSQFSAPQLGNPNAGAAANMLAGASAAWATGSQKGEMWVDRIGKTLQDAWKRAGEDRIRKDAGNAGKGRTRSGPADQSDQRAAQIEQAIAQAKAAELQAQLSLVTDLNARADLQKEIIAQELAVKQAEITRQQAEIAAAKGLDLPEKEILKGKLEQVRHVYEHVAQLQGQKVDDDARAALSRENLDLFTAQRQAQIDLLDAQGALLSSSTARADLELKILPLQQAIERAKLEQVTLENGYNANQVAIAQAQLGVLDRIHAAQRKMAERETQLDKRIAEAVDAVAGLKDAFRRHDWASLFDQLQRTIQTLQASFQAQGLSGGLITTGAAVGSLVGGKVGKAVNTGLGVSMAAGLGGQALGLVGGQMILAGGAGALGAAGLGLATLASSMMALAGPIGIVAGLATLFLGSKPSNHAGITSLTSDSYTFHTSGKETDETKNAVIGASQAILAGEKVLRDAGINLSKTVTGLDLGTRDLTHIFLSSGEELRSAVGDPAAAAETALKGVLSGATFVSDTQKQLVESMLAAGKGFDDIATALQGYTAAQALPQDIARQILQYTDPKAFAASQLGDQQTARRGQVQAAFDAGYLTADQLAAINTQLTQLEGLELADVMKRFADQVGDAGQRLNDIASLKGSIGDQILQLADPKAFAVKQANDAVDEMAKQAEGLGILGEVAGQLDSLRRLKTADALKQFTDQVDASKRQLRQWLDQVSLGASAELSPAAQRQAALEAYRRNLAAARGGDQNALSQLTGYADRLLSADRTATSSAADRLALFNQVTGDVAGLAGGFSAANSNAPPEIVLPLNAMEEALKILTANSNADQERAILETASQTPRPVMISNLPAMQTVIVDAQAKQTEQLLAASEKARADLVAAVGAVQQAIGDGLAAIGGAVDAQAAASAEALAQARDLADQLRVQNVYMRAAVG